MTPPDTLDSTSGDPAVDLQWTSGSEDELAWLARREVYMQQEAAAVARKSMLSDFAGHLISEESTGYLLPTVERMLDEALAAGKVTREELQHALDRMKAGESISAPHGKARAVAMRQIRRAPPVQPE